jgi:phage shock protein PspC (stress-responsive transcriptional regulator)
MKFRPASTCFGCCTLLVGVEVSSLLALLLQIASIAVCSSAEPLQVLALRISPTLQVLWASWALIGIPVAVCAGVGAVFRVDHLVRLFFWYGLLSFPAGLAIPLTMLATGSMCQSVTSEELQRMGSAFVCGFTDTFVFMATMVGALIHLYIVYIVWSAAEEIREANFPTLSKYTNKLKNMADQQPATKDSTAYTALGVNHPALASAFPSSNNHGTFGTQSFVGDNGAFQQAFEGFQVGPNGTQRLIMSPQADQIFPSASNLQPQSFIPAPESSADFTSLAPAPVK